MTDFKIANGADGWDLVLDGGDLVLTESLGEMEVVRQRVVYALSTWLGESVYETTAGLPYEQGIFGFEPVPGVVGLIVSRVLQVDGVDGLVGAPSFTLTEARVLTLSMTILVGDTEGEINLEIGA